MLVASGWSLATGELVTLDALSLFGVLMLGAAFSPRIFRNFELNQMDIVGHPGKAFYVEEEGVPGYDELIVVAHRDKLGEPKLARFVCRTGSEISRPAGPSGRSGFHAQGRTA